MKFRRLSELAELHVVGLASRSRFRRFQEGATFYLVPLVPGASLRFLLVLARAMLLGIRLGLAGRIHVVLCESPYEGSMGVLLRGALRMFAKRVVVITELHGDWDDSPFLYRRVPLRALVQPILRLWTRLALRRSDMLRAVSQFLVSKAERAGARSISAVFPTFTDFDLFLGSENETTHTHSDEAPAAVLYVGGLYPIKGIDVLAEAFSKLLGDGVRARLVVAGEGPHRGPLKALLARPEMKGAVTFLGAVSQHEVLRQMRGAQLLVLPSRSEGLPRVIMEAMSCALPVVASDVGGIPELVEDGVTGFLVPPGDSVELASRMQALLEDAPRARAMGARGREKAAREFSSGRYFEGYRALFEGARERLETDRADDGSA